MVVRSARACGVQSHSVKCAMKGVTAVAACVLVA
jgi:hypothetical protein